MRLDSPDLLELSSFFAKRYPSDTERDAIAASGRLPVPTASAADPLHAWFALLTEAQRRGKLPFLVHAAARQDPEDANLAALTHLFARPRPWRGAALVATAAALVLTVGAGSAWLTAYAFTGKAMPTSTPLPAKVTLASAVSPIDGAASGPTDTPTGRSALQPQTRSPTEAQAGSADDVAAPLVEAPARQHPRNQGIAPVGLPATCRPDSEGLVGYWYAGTQPPGASGDAIVVPTTVNVRLEYPSEQNGYNARSTVQCVLPAGTELRLTRPPVAVPVGHFWVPLTRTDIG